MPSEVSLSRCDGLPSACFGLSGPRLVQHRWPLLLRSDSLADWCRYEGEVFGLFFSFISFGRLGGCHFFCRNVTSCYAAFLFDSQKASRRLPPGRDWNVRLPFLLLWNMLWTCHVLLQRHYIYTYSYIYRYRYTYSYIYIYLHIHICTHIHLSIYIHIHIYIYIYVGVFEHKVPTCTNNSTDLIITPSCARTELGCVLTIFRQTSTSARLASLWNWHLRWSQSTCVYVTCILYI